MNNPNLPEQLTAPTTVGSGDLLGGMVMSPQMFAAYQDNPLAMDSEVRRCFKIPENRYYNVAIFPQQMAGKITVERERIVKAHKMRPLKKGI
jgi:hypothetical protein